jgi:general secretion pathway protein D
VLAKKSLSIIAAAVLLVAATPYASAQSNKVRREQPEPTYTLGSNDMDIIKLIQYVAQATGKTIVIDPAVKGKVKIMTNENRMTKDQLYETFRAVLQVSNYTVLEVGDVTRVIPVKEARTSPVPDASSTSGLHEIVTDVIPVQNISASKLLQVLRPMVSSNASIAPHDSSNSIILTDTKANIDRIRRVIKKVDLAAVSTTEVVTLKFAEADDLVTTLNKLVGADKKSEASNHLQMVADKRNNAILLVGEDLQRERIKALIKRLDRPQQQSGNIRVIYLDYADAKKVADTLTKVVQNLSKAGPGGATKGKSGGATVEADEDTNALLITAEGDMLNSLLTVVDRLDVRRAQVLVEAIIVELNFEDGEERGIEWLFNNDAEGIFGGSSRGQAGPTSLGVGTGLLGDEGSVETLAASIAGLPGQTFGIAGVSGGEKFLAILRALESSSKTNILSTPSLMTMDNNEAEISVGQEIPIATGSFSSSGNGGGVNPFTTFQRDDVGIKLKITPQINDGNKILMDVEQEVSSLGPQVSGTSQFITNQSKITTQILLDDGEIVVLGGLIKDDVRDSAQKVPILGSIPFLGSLFRYQDTSSSKSNLMVFLRAEIMRTDEDMNGATAEKYEYIRGLQVEQRDKGLPLMSNELLPVLPDIEFEDLDISEEDKALLRQGLNGDTRD